MTIKGHLRSPGIKRQKDSSLCVYTVASLETIYLEVKSNFPSNIPRWATTGPLLDYMLDPSWANPTCLSSVSRWPQLG